jgi:hypothetical protein
MVEEVPSGTESPSFTTRAGKLQLSAHCARVAAWPSRADQASRVSSRMVSWPASVRCCAPVAKLANATDLKSVGSNPLWVRSPPGACSWPIGALLERPIAPSTALRRRTAERWTIPSPGKQRQLARRVIKKGGSKEGGENKRHSTSPAVYHNASPNSSAFPSPLRTPAHSFGSRSDNPPSQ